MDSFVALLTSAALTTGGITVLFAVVLALATAPRRPAAVLPALAGVGLAGVWVGLSYQGGVHADETGTSGNVLDDVAWLIAAVVLSLTSLVLSARHRHQSPLTPLP